MPKILGLDIGEKRIGVAISDGLGLLAHPLKTLNWKGPEDLVKQLKELIEQNQVQALVAGIPFTMKGTDSQKTKEVKHKLAQKLYGNKLSRCRFTYLKHGGMKNLICRKVL